MISKETITKIVDAARIDEVVSDFVQLKKRGVNLIGKCPFHDEKTPSFTVSIPKGIYKCFGCGKAGNSVSFVMEHEHFTYREALKYLAVKYNIEVEEKERTNEELLEETRKESLYIINSFAQNYFNDYLLNTEEGKSIGLSYFTERGLRAETIEKFKLGYNPAEGDKFTKDAIKSGYKIDLLQQLGLTTQYEKDFFRGRVLFTIHSVSGKVLGFGGRTLSADKKTPKYINSPETEIYFKSKIVYGIYQARKAITQFNECFLVEGYMDVISLHQSGIENVVASSGTSLTQDQVRLIKRYTTNLTILYDGDAAGVKAALRGLEIALEEGVNVKVVLLPADHDPDTYVQNLGGDGFKKFIEANKKDLIHLRISLFYDKVKDDPFELAKLIEEITNSIALVSDTITRSLYVKQVSHLLRIDESQLTFNVNRVIHSKNNKLIQQSEKEIEESTRKVEYNKIIKDLGFQLNLKTPRLNDLIRLFLENSNFEIEGDDNVKYFLNEIQDITISIKPYNSIIDEYKMWYDRGNEFIPQVQFVNHSNPIIKDLAINLLESPYYLSENWAKMFNVFVPDKRLLVKIDKKKTISHLKFQEVYEMQVEILSYMQKLQLKGIEENYREIMLYQKEFRELQKIMTLLGKDVGLVVNHFWTKNLDINLLNQ